MHLGFKGISELMKAFLHDFLFSRFQKQNTEAPTTLPYFPVKVDVDIRHYKIKVSVQQ